MTSKERLTAVFNRKQPDRVPIWMMFPYESEPIAADVYNEASYKEVAEQVRNSTDFIERNALNVEYLGSRENKAVVDFLFHHPEVITEESTETDGPISITTKRVEYGNLRWEKRFRMEGERTKVIPYVKEPQDIRDIARLPYEIPGIDFSTFRKKAENLGHRGLHGILVIDPISTLHDICDESDFTMWAYTETALFEYFLDAVTPRLLAVYEEFLKNGVGETFFLSGPEYLTTPLGTPKQFRRLVTRYDRRITELVASYGKKTIIHCHGNVKEILPDIRIMNPDALQPMEPPPFGDCTLPEAREELGKDIVLMGNIEYTDLHEKEPEEIHALVRKAIEEGGPENFILCPSCTPYEDILPPKTAENYLAMIDAGLRYGTIG